MAPQKTLGTFFIQPGGPAEVLLRLLRAASSQWLMRPMEEAQYESQLAVVDYLDSNRPEGAYRLGLLQWKDGEDSLHPMR